MAIIKTTIKTNKYWQGWEGLGEGKRERNTYITYILLGTCTCSMNREIIMEFPQKLKNRTAISSSYTTLGYTFKRIKVNIQ
jgi:hypothetical protein